MSVPAPRLSPVQLVVRALILSFPVVLALAVLPLGPWTRNAGPSALYLFVLLSLGGLIPAALVLGAGGRLLQSSLYLAALGCLKTRPDKASPALKTWEDRIVRRGERLKTRAPFYGLHQSAWGIVVAALEAYALWRLGDHCPAVIWAVGVFGAGVVTWLDLHGPFPSALRAAEGRPALHASAPDAPPA